MPPRAPGRLRLAAMATVIAALGGLLAGPAVVSDLGHGAAGHGPVVRADGSWCC